MRTTPCRTTSCNCSLPRVTSSSARFRAAFWSAALDFLFLGIDGEWRVWCEQHVRVHHGASQCHSVLTTPRTSAQVCSISATAIALSCSRSALVCIVLLVPSTRYLRTELLYSGREEKSSARVSMRKTDLALKLDLASLSASDMKPCTTVGKVGVMPPPEKPATHTRSGSIRQRRCAAPLAGAVRQAAEKTACQKLSSFLLEVSCSELTFRLWHPAVGAQDEGLRARASARGAPSPEIRGWAHGGCCCGRGRHWDGLSPAQATQIISMVLPCGAAASSWPRGEPWRWGLL